MSASNVLGRLTGIPHDDTTFNRVPLRPPGGHSDRFKELCDSFETVRDSVRPDGGLPTLARSTVHKHLERRPNGAMAPGGTLGSLAPDDRKILEEKVDELWSIIKTTMARAKQQRRQQTTEKLVSAMEKLSDIIPAHAYDQRPIAVLPSFARRSSHIAVTKANSGTPLYRANLSVLDGGNTRADYAMKFFRVLDTAEKAFGSLIDVTSIMSPPPPGTSSTPPSVEIHAPKPPPSFLSMSEVSNILGSDLPFYLMSRACQSDESYLFSSAVQLALPLQSAAASSSQDEAVRMSTFALALLHLYELTYDQIHLNAAIPNAWMAVMALPGPRSGFPPIATLLVRTWAFSQRMCSRETGRVEFLDRAIRFATTALGISSACCQRDFAGHRLLSMELAECLLDRYRHLGDVKDLDDGLIYGQAARKSGDRRIDTHAGYVLGTMYLERYTRLGSLDDLDEALYYSMDLQGLESECSINIVSRLLYPHPYDVASLHFVAVTLAQRFTVVKDINDLNNAIAYGRKAAQLTHLEHPHHSIYLSDLACLLYWRFAADNALADLEECVEIARTAVKEAHPGCYTFYPPQAVLGLALARLGAVTGDFTNISKGIAELKAARRKFSGGAHFESRIDHDLSSALVLKFEHTNAQDDLEEAIHCASSALNRSPDDDRSRTSLAFELGRMLATRYSLSHLDADLDRAVDTLRCVSNSTGPATTRVRASIEWAKVAAARGADASLEALEVALDILPLIAWAGHRMVIQYKTLISLSANIGPWAAACAISCRRIRHAMGFLERGRNVLWGQLLTFQDGARKHRATCHPDVNTSTTEMDSLAEWIAVRLHGTQLEERSQEFIIELKLRPGPRQSQILGLLTDVISLNDDLVSAFMPMLDAHGEDEALPHNIVYLDASLHSAAQRWASLQSTMENRNSEKDDSHRLFSPDPRLTKLLTQGYVVFLNAHSTRCDALIIRDGTGDSEGCPQVDHVPLAHLSPDTARQWAESIQGGMSDLQEGVIGTRALESNVMIPILQELWRTIAVPVLTHLCISDTSSSPARIWWCPSGPLAFLPLHAAGPYNNNAPGVPELVISSYTPTLESLLRACDAPHAPFSMLAIGQPETPNMSPLPGVHKELAMIERACARVSHNPTILVGPDATDSAVSRAFSAGSSYTWLHISCHAHQEPSYPFDSAFYLHDGPFTLQALMQLDLTGVQFAFLSACLTSAGDQRLPDECIHLAAGMQFAGVRSLVATLWSVDDRAAAFVTDRVYGRLVKEGGTEPDAGEAARALHDAVLEMKVAGRPMVFWVPFTHVGF